MTAFLGMAQPPVGIESILPSSVAGWFAFAAAVWWAVDRLSHWGKSTDKWDRAAKAIEDLAAKLSELTKQTGELLFEIRGIGGKGGLRNEIEDVREELHEVKRDVAEIKERNGEADLLVEIYKSDLRGRKDRGEPIRRDVDRVLEKLNPEN